MGKIFCVRSGAGTPGCRRQCAALRRGCRGDLWSPGRYSHDDGWAFPPPIFFLFLTKRLRPQARVVGQPPHKRRHLGRRQTGRTRKGYAASVSGKAANGCAVDGPKEKIAAAGRSAQSAYLWPPAGDGWTFLAAALMKRDALGETFGTGRARIPRSSLSAGAALVVNAGRRGRRPLQDGMSDGLCVRPVTEFPSPL